MVKFELRWLGSNKVRALIHLNNELPKGLHKFGLQSLFDLKILSNRGIFNGLSYLDLNVTEGIDLPAVLPNPIMITAIETITKRVMCGDFVKFKVSFSESVDNFNLVAGNVGYDIIENPVPVSGINILAKEGNVITASYRTSCIVSYNKRLIQRFGVLDSNKGRYLEVEPNYGWTGNSYYHMSPWSKYYPYVYSDSNQQSQAYIINNAETFDNVSPLEW